MVVETIEALGPEPLIPREPRRRACERRQGELCAPPPALLGSGDQRCALEHLEVSRDGREADGEGAASSVAVASPTASRSTMRRRVASASAPKSRSRSSLVRSGTTLNMIVKNRASARARPQALWAEPFRFVRTVEERPYAGPSPELTRPARISPLRSIEVRACRHPSRTRRGARD